MPAVDTPYVIGVIRSHEKHLLGEDEFVRLTSAATAQAAVSELVETPYGKWLTPESDIKEALAALTERLSEVMGELADHVIDERVLAFIQARYDGLNVATAVLTWAGGALEPGELSDLGSISVDTLHSVVWHNTSWEAVPEAWAGFVRGERERLEPESERSEDWKYQLLSQVQVQVERVRKQMAATPLLQQLARRMRERLAEETELRDAGDYEAVLSSELEWDNTIIEILQGQKAAPVGYDPIVAYWYAVEMEVKVLRLILMGKAQGIHTEEIQAFVRKLYV